MAFSKIARRNKIKARIRGKVSGTAERPRMTVFRSNKQIYVQVINDETGTTLTSASSLGLETMPKIQQAEKVGELVAKKALEANIKTVVFDRGGFIYQGKIQALADAAREAGLEF